MLRFPATFFNRFTINQSLNQYESFCLLEAESSLEQKPFKIFTLKDKEVQVGTESLSDQQLELTTMTEILMEAQIMKGKIIN